MKPFEQQTYYELLEIPVSAPEEEIRAAYARALETYSPDSVAVYTLVDPGQIDALRARLTEAMEILTEPDLRAEYDRMIGVSRGDSSAVKALTPALAAAAQSVPPQETAPASPAQTPAPEAAVASSAPTQTPTPAVVAAPSATEPAPAASAAPAAPAPATAQADPAAAAAPAAAVPAAPLVMPGIVTPNQIHAAFRSYAISYVPVLVPTPSLTSTAVASPFAASGQAEAAPPAPEAPAVSLAAPASPAPAPEAVTARPSAPAAEPVATAAPQALTSAPSAAPVASAEPAPAAAAAEPASKPEAPPASKETPAAASQPTATPPASSERPTRIPTPPPLPPGGRRVTRPPGTPTPPPIPSAGKGSARPGAGPGMDLEEAQQIAQETAIATAEAALAQVAAKAREPRPKAIELPPNTEFNGEVLRQIRESRGLSIAQLADRTRISGKHLENVEADRYSALPATVYLRGILMNIARELGLDPLKVSRSYLTLAAGPKKK